MINTTAITVVDFNSKSDPSSWQIVDDGVMGGRSNGILIINNEGNAEFFGIVSLENNGGFSSVRRRVSLNNISPGSKVKMVIKGDGSNFQFRVRHDFRTYYSYIKTFETTGEWQEVIIPLSSMYPSYRGRKLAAPNFDHQVIQEITFLIGNKKAQDFKLEIDKVEIID